MGFSRVTDCGPATPIMAVSQQTDQEPGISCPQSWMSQLVFYVGIPKKKFLRLVKEFFSQ